MRHALGLGISPADFWKLSVAEWRALTEAPSQALARREFEALSNLYPDEP